MDISARELDVAVLYTTPPLDTEASETAEASILEESEETDSIETTSGDNEYPNFEFSPDQELFIDSCFFMGDSICLGLKSYGIVRNACGEGGIAARNISESLFSVEGYDMEPLTVLVNSGMKNFVFIMGLNDVNIETAQEYADYYDSFLSKAEAALPEANIYILAITPVTADSSFCYNSKIEEYNAALKEMAERTGGARRYIDVTKYMKNSDGSLKPLYSSGDGIHLTVSAYYAMLYAMCEEIGIS